MFKRILVANRAEIAIRIIRTCREMNIETIAVYSTADKDSLHVKLATDSVCIGPASSTESYLNMDAIITAAKVTGCDALHPGFGFLSENSEFARRCYKEGIVFIGPTPKAMDLLGNKLLARKMMQKAGVPVVPGSDGPVENLSMLEKIADRIGYPVLIKASAGGGGRGMRRVLKKEQLEAMYREAKAEARACFGNDEMYLEKLIMNPKHVEFQILADEFGNVLQLGERDCSIQRKNQKLIEESPCMALKDDLRKQMGKAAVVAAKAANYTNAGTVEFVLDAKGHFYFIEMNTRIQVEHGVTEAVTGLDLIKEQIRIAYHEPLKLKQKDVRLSGHAIECRINAEDPSKDFKANTGTVEFLNLPGGPGVRVDTHLYNGYATSPFYDSMLAKIIVHAPTRLDAIRRMRRALLEFTLEGIETNVDFDYLLMHHPSFIRGKYSVNFIEKHADEILKWDRAAGQKENDKK